ncbi:hypothetical protein ACFY1P_19990 [Streptomyces sp. NPDC001407]|uniref:DUF7715 family protein n=1 Tax=Streptomyces sp. NPDC001407 TaxID=3364573 RepID=UPI003686B8AD
MKLVVPASAANYHVSDRDYSWTDPGEVLTIGTDDAFVGITSDRHTTRGRVAELDIKRTQVTEQIISRLTRCGWYQPHRERQTTETRKRMREVFGLARGFEVGAVIELHQGRPRRCAEPTTA